MLMGPKLTKKLLVLADKYLEATGGATSSLSKKAHSDSAFFDRLTAGEISFSARKYDQIIWWFQRNWPAVPWPSGVERQTKGEARQIEIEIEREETERAKNRKKKDRQ